MLGLSQYVHVIAGLDPAIQERLAEREWPLDVRVKPGHDDRGNWESMYERALRSP